MHASAEERGTHRGHTDDSGRAGRMRMAWRPSPRGGRRSPARRTMEVQRTPHRRASGVGGVWAWSALAAGRAPRARCARARVVPVHAACRGDKPCTQPAPKKHQRSHKQSIPIYLASRAARLRERRRGGSRAAVGHRSLPRRQSEQLRPRPRTAGARHRRELYAAPRPWWRRPAGTRRRSRVALRGRHTALEGVPSTSERDQLFEAYNELHALAQSFSKPFDAPAILVVGHQTDGKSGAFAACLPSAGDGGYDTHVLLRNCRGDGLREPGAVDAALVEALMGFQFNVRTLCSLSPRETPWWSKRR